MASSSRTFRLNWRSASNPQRLLDEDALIQEIEQMTRRGFAHAAPGPISIEALDEQHRVSWRAYYRDARQLTGLIRLLRGESGSGSRALVTLPDAQESRSA